MLVIIKRSGMEQQKKRAATKLAEAHFRTDPQLRQVYLLQSPHEDDPDEPIKLLEIVEGTIERGVEPIAFAADPDRGLKYRSVIVEISPREYGNGNLKKQLASRGWTVGEELRAG